MNMFFGTASLLVLVIAFAIIIHIRHMRKNRLETEAADRKGSGGPDDLQKFKAGTASFTFRNVAYRGVISSVNYVALGPGAINVTLLSLQPVTEGPAVPDVPLDFTVSLMFAEVENRPKELIVNSHAAPEGFDRFFSFRVRE